VERLADSSKRRGEVVDVSDTGIGMDEKTRQRCLEPFFTTKGDRGSGLGLAMVYGMTLRHNADLEIESMVGKGTTMRLSFAVPAGVAADSAPEPPPPTPSKTRILVVDDDPAIVRVVGSMLEREGHEVVTANGGQAGMDAFSAAQGQGTPFAVVITDLGMPRVDGRKFASFVKKASNSTLVILLTGWGHQLIAEGDSSPDIDRILSKPPKLRELREALAALFATSTKKRGRGRATKACGFWASFRLPSGIRSGRRDGR
jgi:CheY-like chemotaxis protein